MKSTALGLKLQPPRASAICVLVWYFTSVCAAPLSPLRGGRGLVPKSSETLFPDIKSTLSPTLRWQGRSGHKCVFEPATATARAQDNCWIGEDQRTRLPEHVPMPKGFTRPRRVYPASPASRSPPTYTLAGSDLAVSSTEIVYTSSADFAECDFSQADADRLPHCRRSQPVNITLVTLTLSGADEPEDEDYVASYWDDVFMIRGHMERYDTTEVVNIRKCGFAGTALCPNANPAVAYFDALRTDAIDGIGLAGGRGGVWTAYLEMGTHELAYLDDDLTHGAGMVDMVVVGYCDEVDYGFAPVFVHHFIAAHDYGEDLYFKAVFPFGENRQLDEHRQQLSLMEKIKLLAGGVALANTQFIDEAQEQEYLSYEQIIAYATGQGGAILGLTALLSAVAQVAGFYLMVHGLGSVALAVGPVVGLEVLGAVAIRATIPKNLQGKFDVEIKEVAQKTFRYCAVAFRVTGIAFTGVFMWVASLLELESRTLSTPPPSDTADMCGNCTACTDCGGGRTRSRILDEEADFFEWSETGTLSSAFRVGTSTGVLVGGAHGQTILLSGYETEDPDRTRTIVAKRQDLWCAPQP